MSQSPIFYLVRFENSGEPESFVGGLYESEDLAAKRVEELGEEGYEIAWYEPIGLGDCELCNR